MGKQGSEQERVYISLSSGNTVSTFYINIHSTYKPLQV